MKQVIANGNEDKSYIIFLRALKCVAYIIVFFSLSTNISSAGHILGGFSSNELYDSYQNANFIYLKNSRDTYNSYMVNSSKTQRTLDIWKDLYINEIDSLRPVLSLKVAKEYSDYLILNENAGPLISDLLKYIDSECKDEVYVLYGKFSQLDHELVDSIINFYFIDKEIQINFVPYKDRISVSYFDMDELSGYGDSRNPVIIYCPDTSALNVDRIAEHQNVIYDISKDDYGEIANKYQFMEKKVESEITNVGEYIEYKKNFLNRMIKFLSSLCTIILLLDWFIMFSIINLEYKKNGMEYAVKKILGYGIIKKNSFLYNLKCR